MLLVLFTHPKVCTCEVLTVHVCRVENRIIWVSTSSFSKNWDIILPLFLRQKVFILVHGLEIEYPYLVVDPLPHFVGLEFCIAINFTKYFSVCPKNWQVRKNVLGGPFSQIFCKWIYMMISTRPLQLLPNNIPYQLHFTKCCYQNQTSCRETQ